jgi:hypothetical protein
MRAEAAMAKHTNRVAWGVALVLVLVLLGAVGLLFLQVYPYPRFGPYAHWIATNRGRNARLIEARLRSAHLRGADLRNADLGFADLAGADLTGANLAGAGLRHTNLRRARLQQADLHDADLIAVDMRSADLRGADLTGVKLAFTPAELRVMAGGPPPPEPDWNNLKFTGARYDARTRWPSGFDPQRHGAVKDDG